MFIVHLLSSQGLGWSQQFKCEMSGVDPPYLHNVLKCLGSGVVMYCPNNHCLSLQQSRSEISDNSSSTVTHNRHIMEEHNRSNAMYPFYSSFDCAALHGVI